MTTPLSVLFLHCHDLGRFLGCYGVGTVDTPHLDGLAAEGVRYANAFCAAPQCSPSRASLFTGRYPQQHGVLGLTHAHFGWDLRRDVPHLAAVLRDRGYGTAAVGVRHEARTMDGRGFDDLDDGGQPRAPEVAARTVARLERYATEGRPFYLQVGFQEPHRTPGPHDPPTAMGFLGSDLAPADSRGVTVPPYLRDDAGTRTEIAELQAAVQAMDAGVGTVLAALRRLGLDERTVVVFTTDHGLAMPRAKLTLYDPGLEVALIVRAPGRAGGLVVTDQVSTVDLFQSLVDGTDLPAREHVFAQLTHHDYYDPKRCVRTENRKLIANFSSAPSIMDPSQSWRPRSTPVELRNGFPPYHPPVELYDLAADPVELTDVADDPAYAADRATLLAQLAGWMRAVDDPLLAGPVPAPLHRATMALLPG